MFATVCSPLGGSAGLWYPLSSFDVFTPEGAALSTRSRSHANRSLAVLSPVTYEDERYPETVGRSPDHVHTGTNSQDGDAEPRSFA
jgi:hypothetical protein